MAQSAPPVQTQVKPATDNEINIYSSMGAINICALAVNQVGLDKSLQASIEMIVSVINGVHGGIIQRVGNTKLDSTQLVNGTIFGVVPRVKQICYDKLTVEDKKKIDDIMSQLQKAVQGAAANQQKENTKSP